MIDEATVSLAVFTAIALLLTLLAYWDAKTSKPPEFRRWMR